LEFGIIDMTTDAHAASTAITGREAGRVGGKFVTAAVAAGTVLFLSVAADPASARTATQGSEQVRKPAALQIAACGGKQGCAGTTGGANADASRGAGAGAGRSGGTAGDAGSRRGCGSGLR
jgi:hypothetical protein